MAAPLQLCGRRYGQLLVTADLGRTTYGGRKQTLWQCHCDCGQHLELPSAKLPYSQAAIKSAERAGRLIYTCCESCRMKTCPLCGDRFPYSHPSHLCPKTECQLAAQQERDSFWHARATERYRTDPAYRAEQRAYQSAYYAANASAIQQKRRDQFESLPDDERAARLQRRSEGAALYYQQIRRDPHRYGAHMARIRQRRAEREHERFLADANVLTDMQEPT